MKTEFVPYKLRAHEKNSSVCVVNLKNLTAEPVMSSIVIDVPKQLSVGSMGVSKQKEIKLGTIAPNESKESRVEIFGDVGTEAGDYTLTISAFVHYVDYQHIVNSITKRVVLEAV